MKSKLYNVKRNLPNWRKAPWDQICQAIDLLPWTSLLTGDINEATNKFNDLIYAIIKDFVPFRSPKSSKFPCWFDYEIITILKNKKYAWQLWKQFPNNFTYKTFKELRRHSKHLMKRKYNEYIRT